MSKILLFLMLCCIFQFSLNPAYAQNTAVRSGQVKDSNGKPLAGATVSEKGIVNNGVITDEAGNFRITLKGNSNTIIISCISYKRQEIKIGTTPEIIFMQSDDRALNDVVVVGYQSQKRRDVTAAVSSLKGSVIADIPESSFDNMLQGRLAGVSVLSTSGELGAKPNIVIRGSTNIDWGNLHGGNSGPLYVIDGIVYDVNAIGTSYTNNNGVNNATNDPLSLINPNDIESIDVLKDASAAAIYGARGGNGVIIVKTKSAKRGKPQVTLSAYTGITTAPNFINVTTGAAERALKLKLLESQLPYNSIEQGLIPAALTDSLNSAFNNDVDWQGLLVRSSAIVNSQDVSIAGFSGTTSYRLSFNHYNEQGIINGYSLQKLSPHITLNINPIKGLNITTDLMMSSQTSNHGVGGSNAFLFTSIGQLPSSLLQLSPTQTSVYSGKTHYYDNDKVFAINGSVQVTDTLAHNLTFHSTFGANNYTDDYGYYVPQAINGTLNTAYENDNRSPAWSFENFVQYDKRIKKHHFSVVGGTSLYSNEQYSSSSSAAGISISGIYTVQTVPAGINLNASTSYARKTTESYYARVNYDFDDKYLFMASVRRDASSIYSPEYRWGTFPAFSAGWIASDEHFFEPIKKVVSFFKIRASYGIDGKDPGTWYAKYQSLYNDASYLYGTNGTVNQNATLGGIPSTYNGTTVDSPFPYGNNFFNTGVKASSTVRWERDPQTDVGADIELFDNRVSFTVDWYQKDADNIFFSDIPAQVYSGYEYYSGNYVNVRNRGLEFATNINVLGNKSAFKWNFNFNISYNNNFVTKLPDGDRDFFFGPSFLQQSLTLGEPLFNYKVWRTNGVYATNAQVPTDPTTGKKETFNGVTLQAGDPRYIDMNGDYNITNDDKVDYGNPNPKLTGGLGSNFSYKRFTFSFFFSYMFGRKVLNGGFSDALNSTKGVGSWGALAGVSALTGSLSDFWQVPGDVSKYARLVYPTYTGTDPWDISTDYFVESGDFIKLKNASLGYDLPTRWIEHLGMKRLNVYLMGENLWMWKKSKDLADPELADPTTGLVNVVYPTAAKFTLGVNIDF
ncbi:TonB-linked outer membrane protein, SusC/RagA family [Mucilaginibacter mallensis]|uniref:TonB-linked outer membrane protein, SusC/RagA family n=1 Tax=Mucilaginibacter mallensis TaxID=652787 RepID=A0A1H1PP57_MUCMA|nr:SusC/RagA family TonB-linked outer membrane protein [Mucilaginibacter mallensis]SDS13091.1 TonB-linked outer membrane protein, SusC/RagA family [Mucilaginibacter mallensis]